MKVTIVYDNTAVREDLQPDWGFSALVEVHNTPTMLFDTGTDGNILLGNMRKMGIDPCSIDEIFISHAHFDHTGGLSEFMKINQKAVLYVPPSFYKPEEGNVITVKGPSKIHENIFSTGELERIEQSMAVLTDRGVILIVGCSHPYMGRILETAGTLGKIYAIIGGMHGFSDFELFWDLELLCPTHCTQYKSMLKSRYPQKFIDGGVGRIIEM